MKRVKLLKLGAVVLTSLALVLSTQTTAWAYPATDQGAVGTTVVYVGSCINDNKTEGWAYTNTENGDPGVNCVVTNVEIKYRQKTTGVEKTAYYSQSAYAGVSVKHSVTNLYEIISVSADHYANTSTQNWYAHTSNP